jgi:IS5 family transposase
MLPRLQQVVRQTHARLVHGVTTGADKPVSLFEPYAQILRRGKLHRPTEFGVLVEIQETAQQPARPTPDQPQLTSEQRAKLEQLEREQKALGRSSRSSKRRRRTRRAANPCGRAGDAPGIGNRATTS